MGAAHGGGGTRWGRPQAEKPVIKPESRIRSSWKNRFFSLPNFSAFLCRKIPGYLPVHRGGGGGIVKLFGIRKEVSIALT